MMEISPTKSAGTDTSFVSDDSSFFELERSAKIISIEGNIGSGKTTLLGHVKEALKSNSNVIFLKEPVDDWETIKDKEGHTMLQKFYADQEKYSFPFQMMAYISRLVLLKEAVKLYPNATLVTERSLFVSDDSNSNYIYNCYHPFCFRRIKWSLPRCYLSQAKSRM